MIVASTDWVAGEVTSEKAHAGPKLSVRREQPGLGEHHEQNEMNFSV